MSSISDPGRYQTIPSDICERIDRTIQERRADIDQFVLKQRAKIDARLNVLVKEYAAQKPIRPNVAEVFTTAYSDVLAMALEVLDIWPYVALGVIRTTIESEALLAPDPVELRALVDEHTWTDSSTASPLALLDPETLQFELDRRLREHSLPDSQSDPQFQVLRDLCAARSEILARGFARESKEGAERLLSEFNRLSAADLAVPLTPDQRTKLLQEAMKKAADMQARTRKDIAKLAIETRHSLPGGSREKRAQMVDEWNTGRYKTKTQCIEKNMHRIGISFSTAQKALRNRPHPKEK